MKLSPQEMSAVLNADGPTRYEHFVKRVADWQQVWGLRKSDGWVSVGDDNGVTAFPVWPHVEYARLLVTGDWADASPTAIEVHDWVEEWLPNLADDDSQVAVFPTPQGRGVVVTPEELRAAIEAALAEIE